MVLLTKCLANFKALYPHPNADRPNMKTIFVAIMPRVSRCVQNHFNFFFTSRMAKQTLAAISAFRGREILKTRRVRLVAVSSRISTAAPSAVKTNRQSRGVDICRSGESGRLEFTAATALSRASFSPPLTTVTFKFSSR